MAVVVVAGGSDDCAYYFNPVAYRTYATPGTYAPHWTQSPTGAWATVGIALKPAPHGTITTSTYTPTNLIATKTYSANSAPAVTYTYDANGQRTTMVDGTGTTTDTHDPFGELISEQNGAGRTVTYTYDTDGDNTGITYPLGAGATWATTNTVTNTYDHADLLTAVTDFNGNTIAIANTADGLPTTETLGSSGDTINTTYDPTDTPSTINLKNSTTTLDGFGYSDAPSAAILTETDTPSAVNPTYTYDPQNRVTSMTPGSGSTLNYGEDASSNLTTLSTSATGTYNDASELTASAAGSTTTNYGYNADGQRLTETQGSSNMNSASWNGASDLNSYFDNTGNMTSATYNGDGLRSSATVTPAGGASSTEAFLWNTLTQTPHILMDSTNAYIYAGSLSPVEQLNLTGGTLSYLLSDRLSSTRAVISSAGALIAAANYDAWGNAKTTAVSAHTPFGFASSYGDSTGLLYLLARYYDPTTGQFVSVDPLVFLTHTAYEYAGDNPVNLTDPLGLADSGWYWDVNLDLSHQTAQTWGSRLKKGAPVVEFISDCLDFIPGVDAVSGIIGAVMPGAEAVGELLETTSGVTRTTGSDIRAGVRKGFLGVPYPSVVVLVWRTRT